MVVGVISDTHGLMRPEALDALRGSELILHAGDIGGVEIIKALRRIAPVIAVRGNTDRGPWALELPWREVVEVEGELIYLLHSLEDLDIDPAAAGFRVVITGHSHQALMETRQDVLFLNPGSAGPKRFRTLVSLARLTLVAGEVRGEILTLDV